MPSTIRRCRATGTFIEVTDHTGAGYETICLQHSSVLESRTRALALSHAVWPEWCEDCQKILDGAAPKYTGDRGHVILSTDLDG